MAIFLFYGAKHSNKEGSLGYFLTNKEGKPINIVSKLDGHLRISVVGTNQMLPLFSVLLFSATSRCSLNYPQEEV